MSTLFFISDYLKPFDRMVQFCISICIRFFVILFRKKKSIKLLHLSYAKNYQFNNGYLIIRYRFRNAIWYNFKNIKKTTDKEIIIVNMKNVPEMPIKLVVYGFFRKEIFQISVIAEKSLESNLFRIELKGLNNIESQTKSLAVSNLRFEPTISKVRIKQIDTNLNYKKIKIEQLLFNQNDFI